MSLLKDYFEKTKKYREEYGEKTLVLMQVGAFYEVYGLKNNNDATSIMSFSKICDLNVVDKKVCVGDHPVMMAGFKDLFLDKYVKKLQDAGYTSVVFVQDEQAPNTTRSLFGIFSPGTYFSCDAEIISNNSCCLWFHVTNSSRKFGPNQKIIYVGIGMIDIYTGMSHIFEFHEIYIRNPTTFDELERIISIYNPSETILLGNINQREMDEIVNYVNLKSSSIHYLSLLDDHADECNKNRTRANNCEKQIYQKMILEKFFKFNDFSTFVQPFHENIMGTQAFCYLLDFVYQHNPSLVNKIQEPIFENIGDKLILANHSLKQLNIIDDEYKGKYSSVLRLLNQCVTPMGKRKFAYQLLNPLTQEDYLNQEYDMIEYVLRNKIRIYDNTYEGIKNHLFSIVDLNKICRQIFVQKMSPKNVYQLSETLESVKTIYYLLQDDSVLFSYFYKKNTKFERILFLIEELQTFIHSQVDIQKCKTIDNLQKNETNFIQKGVDTELDDQMANLNDSQEKLECCRAYFHNLLVDYESKSKKTKKTAKAIIVEVEIGDIESKGSSEYVKIHETEKNNYSLVATDRRCKILEEVLKKRNGKVLLPYKSFLTGEDLTFELDVNSIEYLKQSASNRFITSAQINELCKNVSRIKCQFMDMINKIYSKIVGKFTEFQTHFDVIGEFVTLIDILFMKAWVAEKYGYCKPVIESGAEKSFVKTSELRHCLIEHLQQNELYVSNDVILGAECKQGTLLYGTNAVGKTSFIRSLGIAVIMAQAGFYVPATTFVYKPFKYIFTRILGNDNIFKGLSTFAVEMSELRTILRLADKNSLVLGDELCSGTESISASSIFVAGIQKLYHLNCSFIFATHLHEILHYDEITGLPNLSIQHMAVIYDKEKDMLIYDRKLKQGAGDNMYGLEVCKSLNLPEDFLECANDIRMKYHPESASILDCKKTKYNASNVKGICEQCGNDISSEVHHLQHQKDANEKGVIKKVSMHFHKNHLANLLNLCSKCHDQFHKTTTEHKKTKTSKGIMIQEI